MVRDEGVMIKDEGVQIFRVNTVTSSVLSAVQANALGFSHFVW